MDKQQLPQGITHTTMPAGIVNVRGHADAAEFVELATRLCDGYTLDELRRMSLTFKAQIDVLRGRAAVPEEPTATMREAFLQEFDTYNPRATFEDAYRAMMEAAE